MKKLRNLLIIYTFGSFVYSLVEIFSRGFTHWTMVIAGGIVFTFLFLLSEKMEHSYYTTQIITFSILITLIELILGLFLNLKLKMNVWDYSDKPFNLLGQICLYNYVLWIMISIPSAIICKKFRLIFKEL